MNDRVDDFACWTRVTCARTMRLAEPLPFEASLLVMGTKTNGSGKAWLAFGKGCAAAGTGLSCSASGVCNIVKLLLVSMEYRSRNFAVRSLG